MSKAAPNRSLSGPEQFRGHVGTPRVGLFWVTRKERPPNPGNNNRGMKDVTSLFCPHSHAWYWSSLCKVGFWGLWSCPLLGSLEAARSQSLFSDRQVYGFDFLLRECCYALNQTVGSKEKKCASYLCSKTHVAMVFLVQNLRLLFATFHVLFLIIFFVWFVSITSLSKSQGKIEPTNSFLCLSTKMFFNFFLLLCSSQLCDDSFLPLQETGELDLAKTFAEEHNCDIVLGNNPDADCLAVVEKDQSMWTSKIFWGIRSEPCLACGYGKGSGSTLMRWVLCVSLVVWWNNRLQVLGSMWFLFPSVLTYLLICLFLRLCFL